MMVDGWRMTLVKLELTRDISIYLEKVSRKKVAVLLYFVQITPQIVQIFLNAKNVDLSNIQNESLSKILLK